MKEYTETEKNKYVSEFKKCHLSIGEYSDKMKIDVKNLKQWLKEYKEPAKFGTIDVAKITSNVPADVTAVKNTKKQKETDEIEQSKNVTPGIPVKFETDRIKIELKEGYNKKFLKSVIEVLTNA